MTNIGNQIKSATTDAALAEKSKLTQWLALRPYRAVLVGVILTLVLEVGIALFVWG